MKRPAGAGLLIPEPLFRGLFLVVALRLVGVFLPLLEGGAEDVAERGAGVGRPVLGDGLLLLGDLEGLDRDGDLARLLVEGGHPRIDFLTLGEALGPLLRAVAR